MILFMLLGNAILALGTAIFVVPNGLISGGVTGVALILQHFFGISVDIGVYVADVVLFILALWLWEKPLQQPLFSAPWFIRPFLLCLEKFRFL